ncbi:MAG: acyloxyacyl hydrolase [Paludibacteraceae bacterium]|nr:acyloxyacyl hydrolase [Paludibacteraceae bacterium]
MKKTLFILCLLMILPETYSQTLRNYRFKAEYLYGTIMQHTKHLERLVDGPVMGAEMAVEWQTAGERNWHQYFAFPAIGLGVVGLDLGNTEMLGQLAAVYPYLNFRLYDGPNLQLNIKGGAGISFLNKRFDNTATDLNNLNTGNAAIGSIVNVYFAGGGSLEYKIGDGFSAVAGFQWNHASNGSFYQPNSGINMLNTSLGLAYQPEFSRNMSPKRSDLRSLNRKLGAEIVLAGGARELYYRDDKMFPAGSVVLNMNYQTGNHIRIGVGVDAFYDGVYNGDTHFKRTYLFADELKNKFRVGVSLQPELVFGRVQAGIHLGMYLYNPLRNLEPYEDAKNGLLNKPLIYKYNIEAEDGWFYTRASFKYAITKHWFLSLGLKTHLQKAEFIEWGTGFRL